MIIKADSGTFFVFDLDDTLYYEIDFLLSAYNKIAAIIEPESFVPLREKMFQIFKSGGNAFEYVIENFPEKKISTENLLHLYRNNYPDISLKEGVLDMLIKIRARNGKIGIITNGRSITQRNKLKALGLEQFMDEIVISEEIGYEKPDETVFNYFIKKYPEKQFYYFGDNPEKDFIAPKKLNWCCIGIIDVNNLRKFNYSEFSPWYLPHIFINKFTKIEII